MSFETVSPLPSATNVKDQAPQSPVDADQSLSSSASSLSFYAASLNMKDRRAYDRERQKTKKTAEFIVSRAQKEQNPTPPGTLSAPLRALWARTVSGGRHREHAHAQHRQPQDASTCTPLADNVPKKSLTSSVFTAPSPDDDAVTVELPRTRSSRPRSPVSAKSGHTLVKSDPPKAEVALADLINTTPRSPRKPRKGKAGDFELVPPIRSVIALDDCDTRDLGDNLALNEPWEHIHVTAAGDGDLESGPEPEVGLRKVQGPSYAAVLAMN